MPEKTEWELRKLAIKIFLLSVLSATVFLGYFYTVSILEIPISVRLVLLCAIILFSGFVISVIIENMNFDNTGETLDV